MIYAKSIASGIVGAILAAVLMLVLQILAFALVAAWQGRSQGAGVYGFSVLLPSIPVLVFAVAGFVFGFWWTYRKRSIGRAVKRE